MYAVLSFGGFLGMGDKLFAIPFEALQLDTDNHRFTLDVMLEDAPGFDKNNWPSTPLDRVYTHYHRGESPAPWAKSEASSCGGGPDSSPKTKSGQLELPHPSLLLTSAASRTRNTKRETSKPSSTASR